MRKMGVINLIAALVLGLWCAAAVRSQTLEQLNEQIQSLENEEQSLQEETEEFGFFRDKIVAGKYVACGWMGLLMPKETCAKIIADKALSGEWTAERAQNVARSTGLMTRFYQQALEEAIKENDAKLEKVKDRMSWLLDERIRLRERNNQGGQRPPGDGRDVYGSTGETACEASAGSNELAQGNRTRGFTDSTEVDVWIPFSVSCAASGNIQSAKFIINLKPIGDILSTDGLGLKGSDGKTYWYPIKFATTAAQYQDVVIEVGDQAVLDAIKQGRLLGVVQDDSAVKSVKLVLTVK